MWELSDERIKIIKVRTQKEKVNNMTDYVNNVTDENAKKVSIGTLEIRNTVTELKNALHRFITTLPNPPL